MAHSHHQLYKLLQRCVSLGALKQLHASVLTSSFGSDPLIISRILALSATSSFSNLEYAQEIFRSIENPTTHAWNSIIRGSAASSTPERAFSAYADMLVSGRAPDNFTFPFLLKSCSFLQSLARGEAVHVHVIKHGFDKDAFVQSALTHMYGKCGRIEFARKVFDEILVKNVVAWTTMINGYVGTGEFKEAVELFKRMLRENVRPDEVTLASVLSACANLGDLELGRWIHGLLGGTDVVVATALIDMYAKCGNIEMAKELFNRMPQRDVILWTAMIGGYIGCNCFREAFKLFREMGMKNVRADEAMLVNVICGCARSGDLGMGKQAHHYTELYGFGHNIKIGTTLIDMYAKCGEIDVANQIFERMNERGVCCWNAIIGGYAMHGEATKARDLFAQMQACGVDPDEVTFIGILTACNHAGLVDQAQQYFNIMNGEYGIEPKLQHYTCLIDLLGRLGRIREAAALIGSMPMKPDAVVWGALLGASNIHRDVVFAEKAADALLELEPNNHGIYILLSNTYAAAKRWKDMDKVREMMKLRGIKKTRGCSSIKVDGSVHEFAAGDTSHPKMQEIYENLDSTIKRIGMIGYVPKTPSVLFDIEEEEKHKANNNIEHNEKP
ncbi:hypothetical protein ACLOJK_016048 [Asimina triloba]